jgi:hypothetical protein
MLHKELAMPDKKTAIYVVKLDICLRKDGKAWLAKCPGIDLVTQAPTRKGVLVAIQEAVSLWFESCIGRNILNEALEDLGFDKSPWDVKNGPLPRSNFIAIRELAPEEIPKGDFSFSIDSRRDDDFSVEGFIPAYLVKEQLGEFLHEVG